MDNNENGLPVSDEKHESQGRVQVDFFTHENDMMMKDADNERLHKTIREICITFIVIIVIFVTAYTIRTSVWLETINRMNTAVLEMAMLHHSGDTEVANGIYEQSDH